MEINIDIGSYSMVIPGWIILVSSFLLAFAMTYIVIPSIVTVSRMKGLFDNPNHRNSHNSAVPTLGGAAVFLGMLIPTTILGGFSFEHELKYIIVGLLILFFVGMKDDILVISAKKKLLAEVFAIALIVILGNIRVTSFHGMLGITDIPYAVSVIFSVFMFVVIINGFNLIDGIDGLASGIGILTISSLGIWFILIGDISYAGFCLAAVGALLAFFRFNVFSKQNKIFLGDTGSLIIGLIVSIFTIKFLESSLIKSVGSIALSAPAIAIGILIVPLIDTLRVFTLRVLNRRPPFKADRLHVHHTLLGLEFNHLQSTLIILGYNLFIIAVSISLHRLGNLRLLLVILPASVLITSIPGVIIRYRERKYIKQLNLLGLRTWIMPETFAKSMISRKDLIEGDKSIDEIISSRNATNHGDLEPVLHDTYLRLKGDNNSSSLRLKGDNNSSRQTELEEFPD